MRYVVELTGLVADVREDERVKALLAVAGRYFERLVDAETDPLTRLCTRRVFQAQVDSGLRRRALPGHVYYFAVVTLF